MAVEIRAIRPDEFEEMRRTMGLVFGFDPPEGDGRFLRLLPLDRTRCGFDGGQNDQHIRCFQPRDDRARSAGALRRDHRSGSGTHPSAPGRASEDDACPSRRCEGSTASQSLPCGRLTAPSTGGSGTGALRSVTTSKSSLSTPIEPSGAGAGAVPADRACGGTRDRPAVVRPSPHGDPRVFCQDPRMVGGPLVPGKRNFRRRQHRSPLRGRRWG